MEKGIENLSLSDIKKIQDGLKKIDITRDIPLNIEKKFAPGNFTIFQTAKHSVEDCMKNNLAELGITRPIRNFSKDHPINLLVESDATYFANRTAAVLRSKIATVWAIQLFFGLFGSEIVEKAEVYCKDNNITRDELPSDEFDSIISQVIQENKDRVIRILMQGQQFSEVFNITNDLQAHEDFPNEYNSDSINFYNKWTHRRTTTGEVLSMDHPDVREGGRDDDSFSLLFSNEFCERLNETDATILRMRVDGYTQEEIAERLGYKNHSAVTKRLQAIRKQWDIYSSEKE